jgi:hypothetical protein
MASYLTPVLIFLTVLSLLFIAPASLSCNLRMRAAITLARLN